MSGQFGLVGLKYRLDEDIDYSVRLSFKTASMDDDDAPVSLILCRICEEKIPESNVKEHSSYCVQLRQCVTRLHEYDDLLLTNITLVERCLVKPSDDRDADFLSRIKDVIRRTYDLGSAKDVNALKQQWEEFSKTFSQTIQSDENKRLKQTVANLIRSKVNTLKQKEESSRRRKEVSLIEEDSSGTALYKIKSSLNVEVLPTIKEFELVKKLGRGAYGKVYLAKKKSTGDYYAIKTISKKDLKSKADVDHIISERNILAQDNLYMVMEYLNGGDLMSLLESVGKFNEPWATFYISELVEAVDHLHKLGIIHRDIKPHNLLIDKHGHLKLADFGLSRQANNNDSGNDLKEEDEDVFSENEKSKETEAENQKQLTRVNSFVGTPEYLAPEVILGNVYDEVVDWWGVGVVLYELITGKNPFMGSNDEITFTNILTRKLVWTKSMSNDVKRIIDGLLTVEPSERLGNNCKKIFQNINEAGDEVKSHQFFKNVDWSNLESTTPSFVPITESVLDTRYFPTEAGSWSNDSLEMANTNLQDVAFVDFAYANVNQLQIANEEAVEKKNEEHSQQFELNCSKDSLAEPPKPAVVEKKDFCCLVAEDNPIVQKVAQALMKNLGFIATGVENGLEALKKAEEVKYDIIFMDIMMPRNGPNRNTTIVAFTAMGAASEEMKTFHDKGMDDCLPKPFTKNDLYAMVTKWIKK